MDTYILILAGAPQEIKNVIVLRIDENDGNHWSISNLLQFIGICFVVHRIAQCTNVSKCFYRQKIKRL